MTKRTVPHPTKGGKVDAEVVSIKKIEGDSPIIVWLDDGSVLRLKIDVVDAVRIPDAWDADGNPLYTLRSGNIMAVLEAPVELMKPQEYGSQ